MGFFKDVVSIHKGVISAVSTSLIAATLFILPRNLSYLGALGALGMGLCYYIAYARSFEPKKFRKALAWISGGLLLVLIFLHGFFVHSANMGNSALQYGYLVGFELTSLGDSVVAANHLTQNNTSEILETFGEEMVDAYWGWSFRLLKGLYIASYLGLAAGVALLSSFSAGKARRKVRSRVKQEAI